MTYVVRRGVFFSFDFYVEPVGGRLQPELFAVTYVVRRGVFFSFDSVDVSVYQMEYGVRHLVSRRLYVWRI